MMTHSKEDIAKEFLTNNPSRYIYTEYDEKYRLTFYYDFFGNWKELKYHFSLNYYEYHYWKIHNKIGFMNIVYPPIKV